MQTLYPQQHEAIRQIVVRSHREEESFLIDEGKIATKVLQYLHDENMLAAKVIKINTTENERKEVAY
jgi:hypothetical protein